MKFFKVGAPFFLISLALVALFFGEPQLLYRAAGIFAMGGVVLGLSRQVIKQYRDGRVGIHWLLNTLFGSAMLFRGCYLFATGQSLLAIPDAIGVLITTIIHFQLCGYLLKKTGN